MAVYGDTTRINGVVLASVTAQPKHIDGIGIKSVHIDDNHHLIIRYTDDTTADAGAVSTGDALEQFVNDWLDNHPEATTTVEDGSISATKLTSEVRAIVEAAVRYTAQALTAEQKEQARANIGLDNIAEDFDLVTLDRGIELANGTDLDDVVEFGTYFARDSASAETMIHVPDLQMSTFKLVVETTGSDAGLRQTLYIGTAKGRVCHRVKTSQGWQDWTYEILNADTVSIEQGGTGVTTVREIKDLVGIKTYAIASGSSVTFTATQAIVFAAKTSAAWAFYICRNNTAGKMIEGNAATSISVSADGDNYTISNSSDPYLRVFVIFS